MRRLLKEASWRYVDCKSDWPCGLVPISSGGVGMAAATRAVNGGLEHQVVSVDGWEIICHQISTQHKPLKRDGDAGSWVHMEQGHNNACTLR